MERPGEKLKRIRERLKLTYRDVEKASQQIAQRRGSDEFAIALSRLADIENKGTVPTMYRLYTLCAIYRQDPAEVLRWYGVPLDQLASEALHVGLDETHAIHFKPGGTVTVPQPLDLEIDPHKTTFLSYLVRHWGKMPLGFLDALDLREYRYGLIGLDDWSMYPVLQPGSLVAIDQSRRKIASSGWTSEFDRPIYFLEHRGGCVCGWCSLSENRLLVQPHPASHRAPLLFEYPKEIDIIGQVIGVAMLLESRKRRHTRTSSVPSRSHNS
jgi:transcriptional regulator with XRE-family HTH domain